MHRAGLASGLVGFGLGWVWAGLIFLPSWLLPNHSGNTAVLFSRYTFIVRCMSL